MAVIEVTADWSAGVTLTAAEFWQVTTGEARMTHESSPADDDGAYVPRLRGLTFAPGQTIKVKKAADVRTVITRTQVR